MAQWTKKHTLFSCALVLSLGAIAFLSFSYPSFEKVKSFKILKVNSMGVFDAEAIAAPLPVIESPMGSLRTTS